MNRFLLSGLSVVLAAASAMGANAAVDAGIAKLRNTFAAQAPMRVQTASLDLSHCVAAQYDDVAYQTPNYYIIVSNRPEAKLDPNTFEITGCKNGYVMVIDCYAPVTDPIALPTGIYTPGSGGENMKYDQEYSYLLYFDAEGKESASAYLHNNVKVEADEEGVYKITTEITDSQSEIEITYNGRIPMINTNEKPSAFDHIKSDVDVFMTGGLANYQGVSEISGQGSTYLNLYSTSFDPETGALLNDGYALSLLIGHKKFLREDTYTVVPGNYEVSYSLDRFTWYPGREVDYMGVTMPFGSYIRKMTVNPDGSKNYVYGFLKTGDFIVGKNEDGSYHCTLEATTTLGYNVTVEFEGEFILNWADAPGTTSVSNLQDDVELDLGKLDCAHIFHTGMMGGCRTFIIDIGSPSGRDEAIINGGDMFRMELFCDERCSTVPAGTYTVVPIRWNQYELEAGGKYSPYQCNKGRFVDGGLTGTRYSHFEEGRYMIENLIAPAEEGSIGVTIEDNGNYTFDINIMDDAGWYITGKWSGPLDVLYNVDELAASLNEIPSADAALSAKVNGDLLEISGPQGTATLYDLSGAAVAVGSTESGVKIGGIANGVYILRVNNKAIKINL